jgi:uncharacterized damage-inducible protein DinB
MPKITELLLAELDREVVTTRRALERVPDGQNDWKPHPKSMELGYLAGLIATMPSWIHSIVTRDELDLAEPGDYKTGGYGTNAELLEAFDKAVGKAREALSGTDDEQLLTTKWRMLVQGKEVSNLERYVAIRDDVINHLAHHRGQLTVYLRLNDVPVPSIYGPTADDKSF